MAFNPNQPEISKLTLSTKEGLVAKKFEDKFALGGISIELLTTDEAIIEELKKNRLLIGPGATADVKEIIKIVKERIITPYQEKKRIEAKEEAKLKAQAEIVPEPEPEFMPTVVPKIEAKFVENEELKNNLSQYQAIEKTKEEKNSILDGSADIDAIYEQVSQLEKIKSVETDEYYYEFMSLGGDKYSKEKIDENLESLKKLETQFIESGSVEKKKSKKIAAMTEIALEYGVSNLKWYGDNVEIRKTSRFDDVKRGVDGVLEISKQKAESDFVGLGIDATFRGLKSKDFKDKIFSLLRSVAGGFKTKIKYFKEHDGSLKKEFAVPKIVLSFDTTDVKNLVYMLAHADDEKIQNSYKDHNIKFEMMNQIMVQCEKLAAFAKKHGNSIDRKYQKTLQSIEELKNNNDTISRAVSARHGSKISQHFDVLIEEFEEVWKQEQEEKQKQSIEQAAPIEITVDQEDKIDEINEDYKIDSIAA